MKHLSVRLRTALAAAAVFAIAFGIVGAFGIGALRSSLIDEIDRSNAARVQDIVVQAFDEPDVPFLGTAAVDPNSTAALVELDGTLLSSTDLDDGSVLIAFFDVELEPFDISLPGLDEVDGSESMRGIVSLVGDDDQFIDTYAFVATSTGPVDRTINTAIRAGLIAGPLLVLLVGFLVWLMARRALRPVERIRAEVEEISGSDLHRRVPEPGTRGEIGALATTMNGMLERIEQSSEQQRRFAADASHELRSPLASMAAQLDVDLAHPDTASWPDTAQSLRQETKRMQSLVDDLLLLARTDVNAVVDVQQRVALDDLVTDALAATHAPPTLRLNGESIGRIDVNGHSGQLRRLVTNLVDNSLRHANERVDVSLTTDGATALLTVEDDGPGVPVADRERIFERFVRLDDARGRDAGGSGLGLALCSEICTRHGGTISVDSSPTGGARFAVSLPLAQ